MTLKFPAKPCIVWLTAILIIFISDVYAQSRKKSVSRSAVNLTGGLNYPITSVSGTPGMSVNLGYLYVPVRWMGISAEISYGTMGGTGKIRRGLDPELQAAGLNFSSSTGYTYWGFYGLLNLHKIFNAKPPRHITPYITMGASYMRTTARRVSVMNSHTYDFPMYANHIGLTFRVKMQPKVDLLISGRYYLTETYFLDGIPYDGIFDSFVSFQAGLSYKIGVSRKVDFIDWKRNRRSSSLQSSKCPRFY